MNNSKKVLMLVAASVSLLAACAGVAPSRAPGYEATITRTTYGIPHVVAKDYAGLGFGAAYARAQDNICLLADAYVSTNSERSKYFGASGDTMIGLRPAKNIDSDVFYKTVTDQAVLRASFSKASKDYRAMVDGWVAGYNRYLKDYQDKLPAQCAGQSWVREISVDDVLRSISSFSMLASSATLASQIANATPPANGDEKKVSMASPLMNVSPDMPIGSNGWAFGGDATSNGKGLVLGNPHMPWVGINRFYENHLTIPGEIDVAGASIMNTPFVGIGFNRDVAWTHTVDMALHMSLYKLTLDGNDPTAYVIDGKSEAMTVRELRIEVKDGSPILRKVYGSRFGPIVSVPGTKYEWTRQTAFAVADANNHNIRTGDTWLAMARSRKVEDLRAALAKYLGAPTFNTLAADRSGQAMYADISAVPNVSADLLKACGSIEPRLPGNLQELNVMDGSRSACAWANTAGTAEPGLLPASEMSTLYRRDFVQNSNDSYRWTNPAALQQLGPIMGRDPGQGTLRTRAAIEEIGRVLSAGKFDPEVAAQSMLSNKVLGADLAMSPLLELCKRPSAPADACAALSKWDRKAEIDSRGALLFNSFWLKLWAKPELWNVPYNPDDLAHTPRDLKTEGKSGDDVLALLSAAAEDIKKGGMALDAPLGDVQFTLRGTERIPVSGLQDAGVLNITRGRPVPGGILVLHGSSYIQSVTFDEKGPIAKAMLTYSQATDPASPYYADQTREFSKSNKVLHRFPFSEAEIAADAVGAPITLRQ